MENEIVQGYMPEENRPNDNFTIISNETINNTALSAVARMAIIYLISKPKGWKGTPADIEKALGIGRKMRRAITKECEEQGYMTFISKRSENGRFEQYYKAYHRPVPPEKRTKSWEYRTHEPPTPPAGGVGDRLPLDRLPLEPGSAEGGVLIRKNSSKTLENKKDAPQLLTAEELAERTGVKPTEADQIAGQEVLFLMTGRAYCVRKSPELTAWVMNLRRTRGDAAVARLLQALRNPEQHGISRSWATWTIEEALWPSRGRPGAPAAPVNNQTREAALLTAAKRRWMQAQSINQSVEDFLAYGTDIPREIKQRAIQEMAATA